MRLLVLTHTFPPSRHANAKRPGYIVQAFLKAGWDVDVFTTFIATACGAQETIVHPRLRIFRTNVLADSVLTKFAGSRLYRPMSLVLAGSLWPDICSGWVLRSVRSMRSTGPYDRVLAFLLPASMSLTGLFPNVVGRHWTFDYQESVTPQMLRYGKRSPLQRALLPTLVNMERRALHKAGRTIFTAQTNRRAYVERGLAPEKATAHVPYFFDAELFAKPVEPIPEFQIVYFGTFDWTGARTPETFLRSLARFLERHPEARPTTRFLFHGHWLSEHNRFVEELSLKDVVSLQPAIGYSDYIEKLKRSPILLLVVAKMHDLFMPSKIVDYFGARRPILAFVPNSSEMAGVLQQAGMSEFACAENDVQGGAASLEALWTRYQTGKLSVDSSKTGYWSSEFQLPRFLDFVTGSTKGGD